MNEKKPVRTYAERRKLNKRINGLIDGGLDFSDISKGSYKTLTPLYTKIRINEIVRVTG